VEDDLGLEAEELLAYDQEGPGLFDEPLPAPEPACDVKAAEGVVDDEPVPEDEAPVPELVAPAAPVRPSTQVMRPQTPLALYRRYRPDTFAEVIGQEHVTEPLSRAIANNKVNHAYLFSGPRGCGKTTSARILARCLNCETGPTPQPCGICDSCVALATGGPGSIDVIEIDAASHGRVDDARELREGVYFAPVSSRYKIYIIDEAHMVTKEGFNALLKVVEEPPEHVKFIFATTEPEKVIGTVRSRTHHYPFRLVPPRTLTAYLEKICTEEGVDVERGVLPLVVRAGAGSVRDALSVLDQLLGAADRGRVPYDQAAGLLGFTPDALLDEIVDAFAAGDGKGVFATIDRVIEIGQDPRRFAEDLLERMRDLVIVAQVPEAIESGLIDVPDDQAERLRTQAAALGPGELTRAAEVIATGLTQMRGTTAPRLHLELICARVLLPKADADGRGLHARLDRLERRLDMPDLVPGRGITDADEDAPAGLQEVPVASAPPAPQRPAPAPAAPPPAAPAAAASGGPGTADLRRLWPQILEEVKTRKRFTHALLSQNAHVVEVRGGELLLGFANQGTLERFTSGGSIDVLRDCLVEVVGADLRISASVDGGPTASPAPAQATQRAPQRPAEARPVAPAAAEPEPVLDQANHDDAVLDESNTDAAELLASQLGAQLIDEEETG
jgi:DNA polymerase-3 subunit gamma/tau